MASSQSVASIHHLHPVGDVCPTCDQPVPHERAEEIARRLEEQEKRQAAQLTAKLQKRFDLQLTEAAEQARLETDEKVGSARLEAKAAAELAAQAQIDAATAAGQAAQEALRAKITESEAAAKAAAAAQTDLTEQLAQAERNRQAEVEQVRTEAAERVTRAREEATQAAMDTAAAQIQEAEAAKLLAEQSSVALHEALDTTVRESAEAVSRATTEAAAAAQARITDAEEAKIAAEVLATAARDDAKAAKANHEVSMAAALKEQREALEADKASAISVERSNAFEEKQKLSEKVDALQRTLDKKTAEELGEGAELDLFESLKAQFEDDRIVRVKKGLPGADIVHTVVHNGQVCGKIIYDSKNHGAWRSDFITKLRADQMAEGAEHAILTVLKFPQGARQLHHQDGVLVANPARVVALVEVLRRHIIQTHALRIGAQQRAEKTAALYDFMTSDQCAGMFERLDTHAQTLLNIQEAEKAAHDKVWKQQGLTIKASQKVQAELRNQIDSIIGTASVPVTQS